MLAERTNCWNSVTVDLLSSLYCAQLVGSFAQILRPLYVRVLFVFVRTLILSDSDVSFFRK
jgi:hypothetical protein